MRGDTEAWRVRESGLDAILTDRLRRQVQERIIEIGIDENKKHNPRQHSKFILVGAGEAPDEKAPGALLYKSERSGNLNSSNNPK